MAKYEYKCQTFLLVVFFSNLLLCHGDLDPLDDLPTVGVAVLGINKDYALPYFLSCLENIAYPKKRMDIWFYLEGDSKDVVYTWSKRNKHLYNSMIVHTKEMVKPEFETEKERKAWVVKQQGRMIEIREEALNYARSLRVDFLFMLDPDAFLIYPDTLKILVLRNYPVSAPMLVSNDFYSNFWVTRHSRAEVPGEGTTTYYNLVNREEQYRGCQNLAVLHSAVLMSLKRETSKQITYNPRNLRGYEGPMTDVMAFSESVQRSGVKMKMCNDFFYGYVTATDNQFDRDSDAQSFINLKVDAIRRHLPIPLSKELESYVSYPKPSKLGCDKIFMINLERRPERRSLMEMSFKELGMDVQRVSAVDGATLNSTTLKILNVHLLQNYEDPYHKRPMKAGEIGCFLSHWKIWNNIVRRRYNQTMILEDDVHFTPNFRDNYKQLKEELERIDFDFVYLGRKVLIEYGEEQVTQHTSKPLYSYWTVGYIITYRGAKKLIEGNPLQNMLPVDEYIPIMFNQHPNGTWKSVFPNRNLIALSALPLLVYPTHFVGMPGYISDTELSPVVVPVPGNSMTLGD